MPNWNPVEGFVIGGGAAVRAAVREVIRAHRVLAMTAEDEAGTMIVRLAATDAGHVAVAGDDGGVAPGPPLAALRAGMAAAVPDALVLVSDVSTRAAVIESPIDGLHQRDGFGGPEKGGAEWWDGPEHDDTEGLNPADLTAPTVVHTDITPVELVVEAGYQGVPFALLHHGDHVLVLSDQPVRVPGTLGRAGTSTVLTALPDGVGIEVVSPRGAVTWAVGDARLQSVALPGVDVHAGALAEFLEQQVGPGAIARILAEKVPGSDPAAVRAAVVTPAAQQVESLVDALGLPPVVSEVLRGTRGPFNVPGAHVVAPTGVTEAMVDALAIELAGPDGEHGWRKVYKSVAIDRPWVLRAVAAAEAVAGVALAGTAVRRARAGVTSQGNATRGVIGALLLLDAAGEMVLQRALRRRLR